MHVRKESQPTSGKAHPLPQVTAWTTTLRVTAVAQPFPKMRLGKGVKWQRVGPFVESESTLSARDLQGIDHLHGPRMVLSALPGLFAYSTTDNDPEGMIYLTLLICLNALLLISLQYYASFVSYEIISLLLEIHITCRQSCC